MAGTIGLDDITDLGGVDILVTDHHMLMSGVSTYTHTPTVDEEITLIGFWSPGTYGGTIEVGVYRTDTNTLITSAEITASGSGRQTVVVSPAVPLTIGVEYAIAWRAVSAIVSSYRTYTDGPPIYIDETVDGTTALRSGFVESSTLSQRYPMFAITSDSGGVSIPAILADDF